MGLCSLLVLILLVPALLADSIVFDVEAQAGCIEATSCNFNDTHIWVGGRVPGNNDTVTIQGNTTGVELVILANVPIHIMGLTLGNATLKISENQTFSSVYILLESSSVLETFAGSTATGTGQFLISAGAQLLVDDSSSITWSGHADIFGTIFVSKAASLVVNSATYSPVSANLEGKVTFTTLVVPAGQDATFPNGLTGSVQATQGSTITISSSFVGEITVQANSTVILDRAEGVMVDSISGLGTVVFSQSSVSWYNKNQSNVFNGSVVVDGANLDAQNLTLYHVKVLNTTGTGVNLHGNGLVLAGDLEFFGSLIAYGSGGVVITGTVVGIDYDSYITVSNSHLDIKGNLILSTSTALSVNYSVINLGGLLHASVSLPVGSTLNANTAPASTIVGHLFNHGGIINLNTQYPLQVRGTGSDYVQEAGFLNVQLHQEGTPALQVLNGSIFLSADAVLQYSITDKPFLKSATFTVATANVALNGTFKGDAQNLPGSSIARTLPVSYDTTGKTISIKYSFDIRDVEPWMWAVLAVGVALIIVIVVAVIVKCRKRHHYEVVR